MPLPEIFRAVASFSPPAAAAAAPSQRGPRGVSREQSQETVSAIALTAPSREKLLAKLQKMTGKSIVLTETVDPAVLGGLRLDMDGTRLDGTVQRHLERLRTEIDGAVL